MVAFAIRPDATTCVRTKPSTTPASSSRSCPSGAHRPRGRSRDLDGRTWDEYPAADELHKLADKLTDAAEDLLPAEPDERIAAWEAIAAHPAFRRCYDDGRLLDAMLAELDDWQPVAPDRYELVCHDDDPAVAVVRDWLDSGRKADARDLVARIDAARADA